MKWPLRCLTGILIVLITGSCKKNSDADSNPTLLSQVIVWDSALPGKNIRIIEFIYDDLKRVTEVSHSAGDSSNGTIQKKYLRSKKCFYNGNEKYPYKTIGFNHAPIGDPYATVYRFYDNNGLLIRDSVGPMPLYPGYLIREYAWFTNKVIATNTDTYSSIIFPRISKDSFVIHNNNLTGKFNSVTAVNIPINGYQYVYDNKVNPLTKLNIAAITMFDGYEDFLTPAFSKNNITEFSMGYSTNPGTFIKTATFTYKYSYNKAGLPEECHVNGNPFPYKIKFYYSN